MSTTSDSPAAGTRTTPDHPTADDVATPFRMDIDASGFEMTDRERDEVDAEVGKLLPLIEDFPTQVLHVNVKYNGNSEEYEVRLALVLPGQTFATGGVDHAWLPVMETAITKMMRRVEHYKEDLSHVTERRHHALDTDHVVEPSYQIDADAVRDAVATDNYAVFRTAMMPLEGKLRERIGRWVERYPRVEAMIGEKLFIADIMEEVFLMAFDRYDHWTDGLTFGAWVETLVDPAVKAIANDPDGELEQISFLRSWQEVDEE